MHIVRWLMGHPILATWFLGAIAILLSMANSGGNKDAHEDDHAVNQEHVTSSDSIQTSEAPSAVTPAVTKSDEKETAIEETEKPEEAVSVDKVKAGTVSKDAATKTDVEVVEGVVETTEEVVETAVNKTGTQADISLAANKAAETLDETPKPENAVSKAESIQDLGQSSTEEMLLMAREAYWNNGLDEASQIYTQLIELEPTVIEHRGELGNVYWRQGYPKKAAQLYSEIAIAMIEQGDSEKVANMVGFIGLFFPDRAVEIQKRLETK